MEEKIPVKAIREFRKIYKDEFRKLLKFEEARWIASALIYFIRSIAKPIKNEKANL